MHKLLLTVFALISLCAYSQQGQTPELPLSDEAVSIFSQAVFLTNFANQNCESVEDQRIEQSIQAIRNMEYRIEEYNVAFGPDNSIVHQFYVRTFNPPALVRLEVFSRNNRCDSFSFSLISEDEQ